MKKLNMLLFFLFMISVLPACGSGNSKSRQADKMDGPKKSSDMSFETEKLLMKGKKMNLYINDEEVDVIWENNLTVDEILRDVEKNDLVISMSSYGGFEQVGSLGRSYTRNDSQMTTQSGDIVLYDGDKIVIFYGSNTWHYTKLGKINRPEKVIEKLLSKKEVDIRISILNQSEEK